MGEPKIKGIVYMGVKTDKFEELCKFFGDTLGLSPDHFESGFATYIMPNGDKVEIYGSNDPYSPHHDQFTTGPVPGFEVDDIEAMRKKLEAKGIEFVGPIYGTNSRWSHFRGPDGNMYEIKQRPTDLS
jgi:predicted enzyme related to lactoylglutathione lyase